MSGESIVGIGTDGSGIAAALYGASLASRLHVGLVLVFGYESSALAPGRGPLEDQIESIGDELTGEVRSAIASAHPDVKVDVELVRDRPAESLIRVAEARAAEMIVVGHGGAGPLRAALLGSTTYELVHRGPAPILVVPDTDE